MKTLSKKIMTLTVVCALSQLSFGQPYPQRLNTHALFNPDPAFSGYASREINLAAFNLSEFDMNGNNNGGFSFIAADISEDATGTYISAKRISSDLRTYKENPKAIKISNAHPGSFGSVSQILDIKESEYGWNFQNNTLSYKTGNMAYCGTYLDSPGNYRGIVGLFNKNLEPVRDSWGYPIAKTFWAVKKFYSIIEIPGIGYAAGGTGNYSTAGGVIEFANYQLNPLSFPGSGTYNLFFPNVEEIIKLVYNPMEGGLIHVLGVSAGRSELHFYTYKINVTTGATFDPSKSFVYRPNQTYNFRCTDMIIYNFNKVAIVGSTRSGNTMLNLSDLNGSNSQSYNISGPVNFRNIQQIADKFYLSFYRGSSTLVLEAAVNTSATTWRGLAINASYSGNSIDLYRMVKRNDCGILNLAGHEKGSRAVYHIADIKTVGFGTNLHPNESFVNIPVSRETPTIRTAPTPSTMPFSDRSSLETGCVSCVCGYNTDLRYPGDYYSWCTKSAVLREGETIEKNIPSPNEDIVVLPNHIQIPNDLFVNYQIFDILGRIIKKSEIQGNTIETNHLNPGVYILRLQKENGKGISKKFVIK